MKAELEMLLSFIFHCATHSEYANVLFCDLLHRHKSSCCLLEYFTYFFFFLKPSSKEAAWLVLKYFRQLTIWTAVSTGFCPARSTGSFPLPLFTLYFLLIQNETTGQALVFFMGQKGWQKKVHWYHWAVGTGLSWQRNKKNFSASLIFSRLTYSKYRTHKGKREILQYVGINSWSTENRVAKSYFELFGLFFFFFLIVEMNRESDLTLPGWLSIAIFP